MVKELVERIRQKDQRAMSQFYQQYVGELSSVCYRYVPSEENTKDVLQNSFVKIFTSLPTIEYRSDEALRGWMRRVVASEALLFLRRQKKLHLKTDSFSSLLYVIQITVPSYSKSTMPLMV